MKDANEGADTGARFSSPPSSSQSPRRPRFSFPLPLPFPFSIVAKAELPTWLLTAVSPAAASIWNLAPSLSSPDLLPAPIPVFTAAPVAFRHSARSASKPEIPPRGAFLGSKSTHGGAESALSVVLIPSVLHNSRLVSTSLEALQDSTNFSTFPPTTSTLSAVRSKKPFCTFRGAFADDQSKTLVPGGRCTPRSFTAPYSRALNLCSPSVNSTQSNRHLPPSKSSWNLAGWVMSTILMTCTKYLPVGMLWGVARASSLGRDEITPAFRMSESCKYSLTCLALVDSA
mmetsp:Transcript_30115/g.86206  ORF Transcript_30115/g.86206 Transcript_30115/m.86206 type:complete len:286 (-) Transcript_30115:127-984(-)